MGTILTVDDDRAVRFALGEVLTERGHRVVEAAGAAEALGKLEGVDAVVTDLAMPGGDGLSLLRGVRERDPELPVVLLTAHGSERAAVEAMRAGAYDYLTKPFDNGELCLTLERALEARALRTRSRVSGAERALGQGVVGESAALRRVVETAVRLADRDVPVLVRGESGTGKELVASLLHTGGRRAGGPLVRFNCAAVPAELAEAELFGHAKGAYTGAAAARRGYFALAHGGTLVLDEVGELPAAVQPKLLRAAQDGEIQPVGAGRPERVDVRLVACTHRDLRAEARAGRFREDLYYRLAVVELVVPPLRERREDVPALAAAFARRASERFGMEPVALAPELVAALQRQDWPGNVRELENAVTRMVALAAGPELGLEALGGDALPEGTPTTFREKVEAYERQLLQEALDAAGGNQSEAARRLGLSRGTFLEKLKRLGP